MDKEKVENLSRLIKKSDNIVVFTGAGASTESGVSDFRSPGGIWERFDPGEMTYQKFLSSPQSRSKYWEFYRECWREFRLAEPNPAHLAVAGLEKRGKLTAVITQNIDELHQKAGTSPEKVLELHGTMWKVCCLECTADYPWEEVFSRLEQGEEIENCSNCGGLFKPATISFGQQLPERVLEEAWRHSRNCDLFISIGSSLVVYPAAYMPEMARGSGAALVIINREPTPYDQVANLVIHGQAGQILASVSY